jgi:replicative DNA helicase
LNFAETSERTILGAMLIEPVAVQESLTALDVDDFFLDSHRRIFAAMQRMNDDGSAIDLVTVSERLRGSGELDAIGGIPYLAMLSEGLPRRLAIESYVAHVKKASRHRRLQSLLTRNLEDLNTNGEFEGVFERTMTGMFEIESGNATLSSYDGPGLGKLLLDSLAHDYHRTGDLIGIASGIRVLDNVLGGFCEGELTYVGAYPGNGKTSFLLQAMHSAMCADIPLGCISLEMRAKQLMYRLSCMHTEIPAIRYRDIRYASETELRTARGSANFFASRKVRIVDEPGLSPSRITAIAYDMARNLGAKVIFVDFVQIIQEDGRERREAINRVSAALRDTSKRLNIPFVVASQLSRRGSDMNRKPTMQDLRESGNLEQDAHNVILLHRDKTENNARTGHDLLILDKAREAETGEMPVTYHPKTLRFVERNLNLYPQPEE